MYRILRFDQESTTNRMVDVEFVKSDKLILSTKNSMYVLKMEEIIRLEATVGYTTFFTLHGEKIMVSKTIKEYDNLLPDHQFFRVHQSHIINVDHVKKVSKKDGGIETVMSDGSSLPVARRKKDLFIQRLKQNTLA